jgi:hypothetical protein
MKVRRKSAVRVVALEQAEGGRRKTGCGKPGGRKSALWVAQTAARVEKSVLQAGLGCGHKRWRCAMGALLVGRTLMEVWPPGTVSANGLQPWQSRVVVSATASQPPTQRWPSASRAASDGCDDTHGERRTKSVYTNNAVDAVSVRALGNRIGIRKAHPASGVPPKSDPSHSAPPGLEHQTGLTLSGRLGGVELWLYRPALYLTHRARTWA